MKLYMKQKVFSWKDKFYIKDINGEDRYYVEGEFFSFGKKLHVYDMAQREVAFIQQQLLTFLPKFSVFQNGEEKAYIKKRFTFFKQSYDIEGLGWSVEGNFTAHDFVISEGGKQIVQIHKVWLSWGDSYEITIVDGVDEVLALAVVLAIDAVLAMEDSSAAASAASS